MLSSEFITDVTLFDFELLLTNYWGATLTKRHAPHPQIALHDVQNGAHESHTC